MTYFKVDGYTHLMRDGNTNSIVNTNMSEYQEYVSRRNAKNEENQKVQNIEEDLASMKNDIDEIKILLRSLINGSK
jgi:hypothetical protein